MEFAAGGELYDYLSERKVLTEDEARRIFRQIATAVYYCHKHKICHRDLKLENILLDEHGNAKVSEPTNSSIVHKRMRTHRISLFSILFLLSTFSTFFHIFLVQSTMKKIEEEMIPEEHFYCWCLWYFYSERKWLIFFPLPQRIKQFWNIWFILTWIFLLSNHFIRFIESDCRFWFVQCVWRETTVGHILWFSALCFARYNEIKLFFFPSPFLHWKKREEEREKKK